MLTTDTDVAVMFGAGAILDFDLRTNMFCDKCDGTGIVRCNIFERLFLRKTSKSCSCVYCVNNYKPEKLGIFKNDIDYKKSVE